MDNETKKIKLSFIPPTMEEREEIKKVALDIYSRTVSANIGFITATPTFYATLAEEAFEAARVFEQVFKEKIEKESSLVFNSEADFQKTKYEKFATYEKKTA